MSVISDPAHSSGDVMRELRELRARIESLETAQRLESASVGRGGVRWHSGGRATFHDGGGIEVNDGGDLAVNDGGGIQVNDGGGIEINDGGGIQVNDGGNIHQIGGSYRADDADGDKVFEVVSEPPSIFMRPELIQAIAQFLIGGVTWFAGTPSQIPDNYLVCDGSAVSRTTYAALFAVIGTTWGAGDGSTTFNLPNLVGRFARGATTPGGTGGSASHTHTQASTGSGGTGSTGSAGSHSHGTGPPDATMNPASGAQTAAGAAHTHTTDSAGAHTHSGPSHTHTNPDTGSGTHTPPYADLIPLIRY